MKRKMLFVISLLAGFSFTLHAQQWAVTTNLVDWLNFGTMNIEGSVAVRRHLVLDAGAKYNPWMYEHKGEPLMNKERMVYVSARWYPWFALDGWWLGGMAGWMEYASGGVIKRQAEEGDAFGLGVGGGYSLILNKNFNFNIGAYGWAGKKRYTVYECSVCGRRLEQGTKPFVMPVNIMVGFSWIFDTGHDREDRIKR